MDVLDGQTNSLGHESLIHPNMISYFRAIYIHELQIGPISR